MGKLLLENLTNYCTQVPTFIHFSEIGVHDVNVMDYIVYEPFAYYIFDRAYVDYRRLFKITNKQAFFVVRAKSNLKFNRMYSTKIDKATGVKCDQTGKLTGFYTAKDYSEKIRRIKFYDQENQRAFLFLTNNFELSALQIAFLYKQRWQIELFFKWIKQNLKIDRKSTRLNSSHVRISYA